MNTPNSTTGTPGDAAKNAPQKAPNAGNDGASGAQPKQDEGQPFPKGQKDDATKPGTSTR